MAMRERTRSKGLKKSEQLLGSGMSARAYGIAVIGPDPRRTVSLMVMVLAVAIALSFVVLGLIVIPGVLLVFAIFVAIDRPASLVMTNQGVAVLARSEFNGRPRKVLTVLPQGVLVDRSVSHSGAYVHLPDLHLWFRKKEYDRLLAATDGTMVSDPWTQPSPGGAAKYVSGPNPGVTALPTTAAAGASSPTEGKLADAPGFQPNDEGGIIYCSWCGKQRSVNAQAIHHCGSRERPAVYCMHCGTSLEDGVPACASCGTPATQTSR